MICIPEIGSFPAKAQLTLVKGDQWSRRVFFREGSASGAPINLTGCTVTASLLKASNFLEIGTVPTTIVDAAQGELSMVIDEALSGSLAAGAYMNDADGAYLVAVRLLDGNGDRITVLNMNLQIVN